MYHQPKIFLDETPRPTKERKRLRKHRRKGSTPRLSNKEESAQIATFPILVERTKNSATPRQRNRKYFSPELASSPSVLDSEENSDTEEYCGVGCLNRQTPGFCPTEKLPKTNRIYESLHQPRHNRKKKNKVRKVEEEGTYSVYQSFMERPLSRNGPCRGKNHARDRSPDNRLGAIHNPWSARSFELPTTLRHPEGGTKRPRKLPPIDKENRANIDYLSKRL